MEKIELLLPAGNWENLRAAVENGADAVYLGVDKFNARRRAANFKLEEIKEVVDYCHKQGVKVYITLNTLIKNEELDEFWETLKKIYLAGAEAVIIQQIALLKLIKQNFPGLEVHLSTQAAVDNSYFYELIKEADRVILPRELSSEEIRNFIEKTNLKAEIFVQGALCFSYSGKCLFSSFLGGRSGNRGWCAQPCRKKYNGAYLLSMKDLCLVRQIPEMIRLGVTGLKVEGRARSARYVAAAAKTYRKAIDSYYAENFRIPLELFKEMELAFNREFTEGYFSGEKEFVSKEKPMGRGLFLGTLEKGNWIRLEEELSLGDGLGIWLKDRVDGAILRRMEKEDKEAVKEAKKGEKVKLFIRAEAGTKIYKTSSAKKPIEIKFEKKKLIETGKRELKKVDLPQINEIAAGNEELLVKVYSLSEAEAAKKAGVDKVFYNLFAPDYRAEFGAYLPRLLKDEEVEKAVRLIEEKKVKDILAGNLGAYSQLKNKGLNLYLDYVNNVFNEQDLLFFEGAVPILSPELNKKEIAEFKNKRFAVMAQGRVVLMNTKYSQLPAYLTDEKGFVFPVRKEHSYYQILNSRELGLFEEILKLKKEGVKKFFLDLEAKAGEKVRIYRQILKGERLQVEKKGYTKGHFEKGVE